MRYGNAIRIAAATILLAIGLTAGTPAARPLLQGTGKADRLSGGAAAETIRGGRGNDRLSGGGGDDLLLGGRGADRLTGGRGRDDLRGGPGGDVLRARDGRRDRVACGRGRDTAIVDRLDLPARGCERVRVARGTPTAPLEQPSPPPGAPPAVEPPFDPSLESRLIVAGDIADCTPPSEATAKLLDALPGVVAVLGDAVYEVGSPEEYATCYAPTWGRHKRRTLPAPGDHDYKTPGAAGYFAYFGAAAGEPGKGWYSYDIGSWHVVVLNSNCDAAGGCWAGSPQEEWLRADLAAHPRLCTLAYWHSPRFSSGLHREDREVQPFWEALHDHRAELVLSGDDHDYERFAPQTPSGEADPLHGIRQFVVGTGGRYLRPMGALLPNSEISNADTFGVLELGLNALGYDWKFRPAGTGAFTDSGSGSCR